MLVPTLTSHADFADDADFRPARFWITQIFSAEFFYFPQISQMHTDY